MSGQFEQRRLARPSYQLAVLDSFAGTAETVREARRAWRELAVGAAAARRADARLGGGRRRGSTSCARSSPTPRGSSPALEDELRADRERLRHVTELAAGAPRPSRRSRPTTATGAADLVAAAERAVAPLERLAPELAAAGEALRAAELQLRETASDLRGFLASLEAEPDRVEAVEAELERIADAKRRYRAATYEELLERADGRARRELAALDDGHDPARAAAETLAARPGRGRPPARRAARGPRRTPRRRSPRRSPRSSPASGWARASSAPSCAPPTRAPRAPTRSRSSCGRTPGLPFGAGRRDRVGRRAVADRARDRGRRRRRDDGLRRDRRRHRRPDRARRRRDAAPARRRARRSSRSRTCRRSRASPTATSASRRSPGDPTHTRIEPLDADERREELERMLGGADFLATLRE